MKGLMRQIIVALSGIIMVYANFFLSGNRGFDGSGPETGGATMYDMFPTAVSPAPYTFTVWLPIFLGVIIFIVYQALPNKRTDNRLDALGLPITAAFLSNTATAFTPIGSSVLAILALLISLFFAFKVLVSFEPTADRGFNWIVRAPIILFFGWTTVATILNISQWLVSAGWGGFGIPATVWGGALILTAATIGWFLIRQYQANIFGLVLIWAFWGIVAVDPDAVPVLIATLLASGALLWGVAQPYFAPQPTANTNQ